MSREKDIARGRRIFGIRDQEKADAPKALAESKAARSAQLGALFQTHLQETEEQVERLTESLKILDASSRAKPCKGIAGLVEEGE